MGARDAKDLRSLSLGIWIKDRGRERLVGQITLGGIVFGAYRGGYIGYWIDNRYANNGVVTHAVMALTEYAFEELSLHRIEINMRPENGASQRVAEKAGYIYEGLRLRYLHIDGQWRDHMIFVKENPRIQ
jgi:ribosomal-protein-alanine N-acetyltransferase